jgi:hypothetical protein
MRGTDYRPPDAPSRPQMSAMAGWRLRFVRVNAPTGVRYITNRTPVPLFGGKLVDVRFGWPAQPVDATQALNLSAGVSNCKEPLAHFRCLDLDQSVACLSPAIVSAKWEYSRLWLETFGRSGPSLGELGVRRRERMREFPLFRPFIASGAKARRTAEWLAGDAVGFEPVPVAIPC